MRSSIYPEWVNPELAGKINHYFILVISSFGIAGNILMLIVFSIRDLRKHTFTLYLQGLAIASLYSNIHYIINLAIQPYFHTIFTDDSLFWCKTSLFWQNTATTASAWFQVAASFDRFLLIVFPMRLTLLKSNRAKWVFFVFVLILSSGLNAYWIFDRFIDKITRKCSLFHPRPAQLAPLIYSSIIPFCLMVIFSISMYIGLKNSRKRAGVFSPSSSLSTNVASRNRTISKNLKFVITMIALNIVFLVTNAPFALFGFLLLSFRIDFRDQYSAFFFNIVFFNTCTILFMLHFSITFYVQLVINDVVRRCFFAQIKKIYLYFRHAL